MKQVARWLDKLTQEAETCKEANEQIAIAFIRSKMMPEFKTLWTSWKLSSSKLTERGVSLVITVAKQVTCHVIVAPG